jgi:hypothetical protein
MAIDVLNEHILTFRLACREQLYRHPSTGKPGNVSTIHRHALRGSIGANGRRVRLEYVHTPRGYMTSREAIQRFIDNLSDADYEAGDPARPTIAGRAREAARVDRALDKAGIE